LPNHLEIILDFKDGRSQVKIPSLEFRKQLFMIHLQGLALLENEYKAVLQSRTLIRYYFKKQIHTEDLALFYKLETLGDIEVALKKYIQEAEHERIF
jgi:hypothetical protein